MKVAYILVLALVCANLVTAQDHVTAPRCTSSHVSDNMTPVDLYPMAGQCIQDSDYADALTLFALAGADLRYDRSRVNDKSTSDFASVLMMRTFQSLPASAKEEFGRVIDAVVGDKSAAEYLCRRVQKVGPPAYYPEYMIMHGMNAITAGLTKATAPQELLPVSDPSGTWKTILTGYLHCSLTEQSGPWQDAQGADHFRKTIAGEIAISQAQLASQPIQASHSGATPSSPSSFTANEDGARAEQSPIYGPLTFNREGADFYFAQDGKFAPASVTGRIIEIHLHPRSFQIGYNGEQMNICLAPVPFEEVRADPTGYKASCLAGAMSGARAPNSDALLVYSGNKWGDGNTTVTDATSLKAAPMKGFKFAYQVNQLLFLTDPAMSLRRFRGTLYGYVVVYTQPQRNNKEIMPIHLIFE
ncbi:MAG TPA: hypothetical protein VFB43_16305 [Terracidiphilus sp.]|nr:hypothetical protein [Terracidiphilus sp.]